MEDNDAQEMPTGNVGPTFQKSYVMELFSSRQGNLAEERLPNIKEENLMAFQGRQRI